MKPGEIWRPEASIVFVESVLESGMTSRALMRSPIIPISLRMGGDPVPSTTVPPLITRSNATRIHLSFDSRFQSRLATTDLRLQRVLSGYYMAVVTPQVMYLHSVQ